MTNIDLTLEKIDNTLDEVDMLIHDLPLDNETKKDLTKQIYAFWMNLEEAAENV
jgi:hypothetical protein